jgi:hypothetical protein
VCVADLPFRHLLQIIPRFPNYHSLWIRATTT